jgi:6-phosphogluconolactonase (cycloisomerase 2 family)
MKLLCLAAALFGGSSLASRLFAASYAGLVTTLDLDESQAGYRLTPISDTNACGASPSWLMPDADNGLLYCLNEAIDGSNATLTSFKVNTNGSLTEIYQLETVTGPVHSRFYSAGGRTFFVVAH